MTVNRLEREQYLDHPLEDVFAFFAQAHFACTTTRRCRRRGTAPTG